MNSSTGNSDNKLADENNNVTTLSHGMVELIHTLTNPQNYQILVNSLKLLTTNIVDSDRFIKKLFTVFAFNKIFKNEEMVKNTILSKFSSELADRLYSGDESYSFGK